MKAAGDKSHLHSKPSKLNLWPFARLGDEKPHKCPVTTFTDIQPSPTRQFPRSTTRPSRSASERGYSRGPQHARIWRDGVEVLRLVNSLINQERQISSPEFVRISTRISTKVGMKNARKTRLLAANSLFCLILRLSHFLPTLYVILRGEGRGT